MLFFIIGLIKYLNEKRNPTFDFLNYHSDSFHNYVWTWDYEFNSDINKHVITNLQARCPECGTPLRERTAFLETFTECPRCDYDIRRNLYSDLERIQVLIIDNIERSLNQVASNPNNENQNHG